MAYQLMGARPADAGDLEDVIVVVPLVASFLIMFFGKKMPWKGWEIAWGAIAFVGVLATSATWAQALRLWPR